MNQQWQDFLRTQGAHLQDDTVLHFGDATAERNTTHNGTVLCDLSQFGLLKVSGEDARPFLQNLLSNDIRDVTSNRAQLSSFNNAKGRMLASMLILPSGNDYLLQLPRGLCETLRKKLSLYVLRSKVKVSEVSDEFVCIGVAGINAQSALHVIYPKLPLQNMEVVLHDADLVLHRGGQRFQIIATPQRAIDLWQTLSQTAQPSGSICWDWLDIRAGIPFVQAATLEAFVPQMLNFEVIGGVNFKKGCYPGQEVVARMHYLGKPKRRMYLAHLESDAAPHAGDELFSADGEAHVCGTVVSAAAAPQGGFDLLAVVQTASYEQGVVHWGSLGGALLQFLDLPYPLP